MASDRVYLDANVLADYVIGRLGGDDTGKIFSLAEKSQVQLYTSPISLHIIDYIARKAIDKKSLQKILLGLIELVKLISPDNKLAKKSIGDPITNIEDSLHYYTALEHNCQYFISNDKKLAKKGLSILPILSPEEYLKQFVK